MKPVRCEGCGKSFAPKLKEQQVSGGGAQQHFRCPHCHHTYIVAHITAEGLRIRRQMQRASPAQVPKLRRRMAAEVRGP